MENKIDIFDILEKNKNSKYETIEFNYNTKKEKYVNYSFEYKPKKQIKAFLFLIGFIKYITTSSFIFAILLLTANYSAYTDLAKSYFYADEIKQESTSLLNSVEASKITNTIIKKKRIKEQEKVEEIKSSKTKYNFRKITQEANKKKPTLNIEITPYENRVIIPKIGKNIPLLDIKQKNVDSSKQLENIFMKELEDGIVRYPGSTKPGKPGNTFVFGHSSNYPWIKGDYNEVFVNLNKLNFGDEVVVYYNQNKYIYKIREKKVISPGNTKILKRNKDKDELTLMTCWPIGTNLNRLIVIGELINKK